jgi:hypothetical protein
LGYAMVTSATNADYALTYFAPPGISHQVMGGIGIKVFDSLTMDIAGGYIVLASRVEKATPYNAGIGEYASHGFAVSETFTFHM